MTTYRAVIRIDLKPYVERPLGYLGRPGVAHAWGTLLDIPTGSTVEIDIGDARHFGDFSGLADDLSRAGLVLIVGSKSEGVHTFLEMWQPLRRTA